MDKMDKNRDANVRNLALSEVNRKSLKEYLKIFKHGASLTHKDVHLFALDKFSDNWPSFLEWNGEKNWYLLDRAPTLLTSQ
ncbi:hypothetical protein DL98DRAFT_589556 [Cadophora sp. DSE1049]|nr:hypothetical protein DL98DRAFT_589556 [Cadophora sp. DSE1049]